MLENCVCTFDSDAGVLVGKLCNAHQRIIDAKVASAISDGANREGGASIIARERDNAMSRADELEGGMQLIAEACGVMNIEGWIVEDIVELVRGRVTYAEAQREALREIHRTAHGFDHPALLRVVGLAKMALAKNPIPQPNPPTGLGDKPECHETSNASPGVQEYERITERLRHQSGKKPMQEAQERIQRDMAATGTARARDVFAILGDPSKAVTLPASEAMNELARKVVSTPDTRTEEEIIRDGVAFVMGPGGDEGTRARSEFQVGRNVETLIAPARELLALYDWRPEIAKLEATLKRDGTDAQDTVRDVRRMLREYGERKKAGWIALRAALNDYEFVACNKPTKGEL